MADGILFELQENAIYTKFEVAYDHEKDFLNDIWPSK
jgi:hypothetical protein